MLFLFNRNVGPLPILGDEWWSSNIALDNIISNTFAVDSDFSGVGITLLINYLINLCIIIYIFGGQFGN